MVKKKKKTNKVVFNNTRSTETFLANFPLVCSHLHNPDVFAEINDTNILLRFFLSCSIKLQGSVY